MNPQNFAPEETTVTCCEYPQPQSLAASVICGNCGEDLLADPAPVTEAVA